MRLDFYTRVILLVGIFVSWSLFAQDPTPAVAAAGEAADSVIDVVAQDVESGLLGKIIMYVIATLMGLKGVHGALEFVKDKTVTKWDNKAAEFLGKLIGFAQKFVDLSVVEKKSEKPKV